MTVDVVIVLLFARFVQVAIVVEEVAPGRCEIMIVPVHLLTHVYKVFSGHRVVEYSGSSNLLKHLSREEGSLLIQVVHLAGGVRQHELEGLFRVVESIHCISDLFWWTAPLVHVASFEEALLVVDELFFLGLEAFVGLADEPPGLFHGY